MPAGADPLPPCSGDGLGRRVGEPGSRPQGLAVIDEEDIDATTREPVLIARPRSLGGSRALGVRRGRSRAGKLLCSLREQPTGRRRWRVGFDQCPRGSPPRPQRSQLHSTSARALRRIAPACLWRGPCGADVTFGERVGRREANEEGPGRRAFRRVDRGGPSVALTGSAAAVLGPGLARVL